MTKSIQKKKNRLRKSAEIIRWTHAKRMNVETNYTFQIINSKWIIYLDYKMQTVKYLKENIDKQSRSMWVGNEL